MHGLRVDADPAYADPKPPELEIAFDKTLQTSESSHPVPQHTTTHQPSSSVLTPARHPGCHSFPKPSSSIVTLLSLRPCLHATKGCKSHLSPDISRSSDSSELRSTQCIRYTTARTVGHCHSLEQRRLVKLGRVWCWPRRRKVQHWKSFLSRLQCAYSLVSFCISICVPLPLIRIWMGIA